jgi:hypothetical protein
LQKKHTLYLAKMPPRKPDLYLAKLCTHGDLISTLQKMQTRRPNLYFANYEDRETRCSQGDVISTLQRCRHVDLMCKDVDTETSYVKDADIEAYFAV